MGLACLALATAGCASSSGRSDQPVWSQLPLSPATNSPSPETAENLENPAQVYLKYARWQEYLGRLGEARKSYKRVLGEDPQSVEAIVGLARLDHFAGRTEQAEQGFLKAVRMKPEDPAVLDALGQFYASEKRWDRAIEALRTAARVAPENEIVDYHLAVALARSGDIEAARRRFRQTVGDAEAHYNVGYILYEQGKLASAETHFQQAVEKKPDLSQARAMLAEIRTQRQGESALAKDGPAPSGIGHDAVAPSDFRQPANDGPKPRPFPVAENGSEPSRTQAPSEQRGSSQWRPRSGSEFESSPQDPFAASGPRSASHSEPLSDASSMTEQQREQWQNQRTAEAP